MPRERSQNREALKGGLALGALILAFLFIFFLADVRRFFTKTDDLHVLMPSAAGLQPGSLVWIAGQTVGEVKEIEVRPPGSDARERVRVHVQVERRYREHIRRDSQARVTSFNVIGDPVLDITPGSPSLPALEPDDTLGARASGSAGATIERALTLQASLNDLVAESKVVATRARDRQAHAERMLNRLGTTVDELEAFTTAVQEGPVNTLSDPEFNRVLKSLGGTITELRASFQRAADRASAARPEAEPLFRRLAARTDTISQAIAQLQQAITQNGGGLLTRAMTDTAIVKALHGAQAQLDSLVAETKRAPWRFWF
jgi:phospholipid/cholesterol/gamma-HCH transport system substrate-binding protein